MNRTIWNHALYTDIRVVFAGDQVGGSTVETEFALHLVGDDTDTVIEGTPNQLEALLVTALDNLHHARS